LLPVNPLNSQQCENPGANIIHSSDEARPCGFACTPVEVVNLIHFSLAMRNRQGVAPTSNHPLLCLLPAGDYTMGDYPATLEGAVQSGLRCAELINPQPCFLIADS
jgi:uncharacterized protein with NAD-binding domain and iron-sulfur cluster